MGLKVADSMAASLCSVQPDKESWKEGCHEEWDQRKGQFAGLDFEQAELLAHLFIAKTMMMLLEAGDLVPVASSRR